VGVLTLVIVIVTIILSFSAAIQVIWSLGWSWFFFFFLRPHHLHPGVPCVLNNKAHTLPWMGRGDISIGQPLSSKNNAN